VQKIKYKFLIYFSYSYSIPIGRALEKEIRKNNYTVKWFCDQKEGKNKLDSQHDLLEDIEQVIEYKPDIVLTATNVVADFISGLKVQVFHGFNAQKRRSKKNNFSHFNIRGFFDLYCTHGPSTTEYFKELAQKHKTFSVVETGWPKMDPLFDLNTGTIDKKPNRPTLLIASTFSKKLSLAHNDAMYQEICRLIKINKYKFLLILHPKMDSEIVNKWKRLVGENLIFYDTTDIIPLFKQADKLIADTTSVIQEFILQRKPVIALCNNTKPDYLINIDDPTELENKLNMDDSELEPIFKNIDKFIHQVHPYNDGQSSARIIQASIDCLHADKSHLKHKPFNFIRKFKVRKQLGHFTLKSYNRAYTLKNRNV
jgi:hypothetical protein